MPDICDLILDDHEQFRRHFAELDELRAQDAPAERLRGVWEPLAALLERHAAAEEELFYPSLLHTGEHAEEETEDAVSDHNDIRAAVARAGEQEIGAQEWWSAVLDAREENSDHMAEEEREPLPDFRAHAEAARREDLGARWLAFAEEHAGARGLDLSPTDVASYLQQRGG